MGQANIKVIGLSNLKWAVTLILASLIWASHSSLAQNAMQLPSIKPLLKAADQHQVANLNLNPLPGANSNNIKPLIQAALAAKSNTVIPVKNDQVQSIIQPVLSANLKPVNPSVEQPTQTPLFDNNNPITVLDYSSINDEILRKKTANFVYFNANFNHCRHCHKFIEIWSELAVDIKWWRQVIRLFSINCSDEDNIEVCRKAGVTQFPQVKYYWVMSNSLDQDGQRLRILGKSVHAMRHLIMDKVLESYHEHNKLLAQRNNNQQRLGAGGGQSAMMSSANPMLSMMAPMIGQLMNGDPTALSTIMGSLSGSKSSQPVSLTGLISSMGGIQGISQLMNMFTGKQKNVQPLPNNWPEFEPIIVSNTQDLLDLLPVDASKSVTALLIMDTQEFLYTGLEVMLDLSSYSNQTYIARVKDERSQLSKNLTKRDDIQAPALIHVTALREPKLIITAPKYTNDEDLRRIFVRAFEKRQAKRRVYPVATTNSIAASKSSTSSSSDPQEDDEVLSRLDQVYMNDLTNALRLSLTDQVFRHSDLSDDQYNALVKYVYVLINYFPFNQQHDGLKFFKRLHAWLQNQVSPIDINEYKKQFHDIDDFLPMRDWMACKSLSNTKIIPSSARKSGSLFENPAQIGKVVGNLTRLLRGQQHQIGKLKNLFSAFTSNMSPVMLSPQGKSSQQPSPASASASASTSTGNQTSSKQATSSKREENKDSPLERIIKSLTSGSLGSESSILKLISTAFTGGSEANRSAKSKFAREYPCGAWRLAHVMVVNEYVKDSPRKDVKHIVLHSLYQYMLHFYTCATCGNRVSDVSSEFRINLDESLSDQADSVLLLWKVHNRVNKRLESEIRPGSPSKLQFPSESLCPKCRSARAANEQLMSTLNWSEKLVLNFLVHHYRTQSIISSSSSGSNSSDSSSAAGSRIGIVLAKSSSSHSNGVTMMIGLLFWTLVSRWLIERNFPTYLIQPTQSTQ